MSAVEEISETFEGMVRDFGTTLRLGVGIAVFTFALPTLLQLGDIIRGLTKK